jgi:hypothetical protein
MALARVLGKFDSAIIAPIAPPAAPFALPPTR